jgi:MFS superfamily sulfate permease-like transporter
MKSVLQNFFPFIRWFPITGQILKADSMAGITVALILVPQSMAYAQLAGLPVVYGLYASFIPVIIASLWGSSSQLHTGPVAMLSLMSAAALLPFANPGSTDFIQLSIMLAMMVGVLRLALGIFHLGAIVNLLSSPVIVGFTNAAALIIGLSQLSKVIGVPATRTDSYLLDLWRVVEQIPHTHLITLLFAIGTIVIIYVLKRFTPTMPGILIAVVLFTIISYAVGFEKKIDVSRDQIKGETIVEKIDVFSQTRASVSRLTESIADQNREAEELSKHEGVEFIEKAASIRAHIAVLKYQLSKLKSKNTELRVDLHGLVLNQTTDANGQTIFLPDDQTIDVEQTGGKWHFSNVDGDRVILSSGGEVVGVIPKGLPSFAVPTLQWDLMLALLPAALVMALIGFMEATSISKAIATNTGERVNTDKELVGQGLANIAGSFFSSYTVSGSFSRSAVAARAGAKTGLFAIISALAVVLVLLFFTSYLYHLPQAVLAVIVMMAVFTLIRIEPLIQAWKVDRISSLIGVTTFFATLIMAPSIANGILLGVALTVLHYLITTMQPRAEVVSRKLDGTLGGIRAHGLKPISELYVPVRFDGSLTFINVAYFEDIILEAQRHFPRARVIMVIGSGINEIDASGEEKIREIYHRLKKAGIELVFTSLKFQVMQVMVRSGLVKEFGMDAFYPNKQGALASMLERFKTPDESVSDDTSTSKA